LERVQAYVAETIRVSTRFHVHDFSMFRNVDETYQMMEQLANFAAKKFVSRDSIRTGKRSLSIAGYSRRKEPFKKKISFLP
jgi:hypothetical protein